MSGVAIVLLFVYLPAFAQSQPAQRTILDGVYSEAQARRGLPLYTTHCAACHGNALEGVSAPELTGNRFTERWREGTLDGIYSFIKQRMPPGRAASTNPLPDGDHVDIISHVLKTNGYPSGPAELVPSVLSSVLFVGKNGPQPVPDGALVITVGCLSQAVNGTWVLMSATEPARTRSEISNAADVKGSSEKKPGTLTLRLADLDAVSDFTPDAHRGHKIQAKGYLVRQPNAERISVSAMDMVDSNCGP
jgi:S-disulfanyl-L-cysteine oxidoreductase SoxD